MATDLPETVALAIQLWEDELQNLVSTTTKYSETSNALCSHLNPTSPQLVDAQREIICRPSLHLARLTDIDVFERR